MSYSDFLEKEGFYKDIDEERKKIDKFQNYRRFFFEIIVIVLIGGSLVNLVTSALYDLFTVSVNQDKTCTIFGVSLIGLLGLFYWIHKKSSVYLPTSRPSSMIMFHLTDIVSKFGFGGAKRDIEIFTTDGIQKNELKLYVDKLIEIYQKRYTYKDIYNLQHIKTIDKWMNGYRIIYHGHRGEVNISIEFWITEGIPSSETKIHDISFTIIFIILNPENHFADEIMNEYKKHIVNSLLSDFSMTCIYTTRYIINR